MSLSRPFGTVNTVGMQLDDCPLGGISAVAVECEAGSVADNVVPAVLVDALRDPKPPGDGIVISVELERLSGRRRGAVLGGLL